MKDSRLYRKQQILYILITVSIVVFLFVLWVSKNTNVEKLRDAENYVVIQDVIRQERPADDLADGNVVELSFQVDEALTHDTELSFYTSHQWVEVWVGEDMVYRLQPGGELPFIKTGGAKWVRVPVYADEAGEMVRVTFTPAYENHPVGNVEFYLGSFFAVYRNQFHRALPVILLCVVNILIGIFLLIMAAWLRYMGRDGSDVLALGCLGITFGLWQLAHNDYSPFLAEGKEIFLYYVSVTMMLVCMLPLVRSAVMEVRKGNRKLLRWYMMVVSIMALLQMVIQFLGLLDLREMFPLTHGAIIIGALLLIVDALISRFRGRVEQGGSGFAWVLAAGALGDLILYYARGSSSGLILILLAVLCFIVLEGTRFYALYVEQSRRLAEKEMQLENSRAMTMVSQIRSHFVFNLLNAISGMCKYDPEKADETIVRFARYLRNNIDIMEDDSPVPFGNELRHLEDYVLLEQIRFGDKITFITDVEDDSFMIPPLILQPLVENAIKHGITKKSMGGTILLRSVKEDERIIITIEDDGVGMNEEDLEKKQSVGLKNVRYRLTQLVGGSLELTNNSKGGVTATVIIPGKEEA